MSLAVEPMSSRRVARAADLVGQRFGKLVVLALRNAVEQGLITERNVNGLIGYIEFLVRENTGANAAIERRALSGAVADMFPPTRKH